ncbi:MAG: hypothetical protein ABI175_20085 [Polyangiales bacterium]
MLKPLVGVATLLVLSSGCYFYYPKKIPTVNGALVIEGEQISIRTRSLKRWGSCSDSDYKHDRCEIVHGKLKAPYTVYAAKAVYNGNTLTRAEFNELVYPDYAKRIKTVTDAKAVCSISLVPSVAAVAVAVLAYVGPLMSGNRFTDDQKKVLYIGGGIGAAGLALLSYPLGGYACVRAANAAGGLFESAKETEWESFQAEGFAEVEKLANDFNARRAGGTPPAPADGAEPEPPPADESVESTTTSRAD